MDNGVLVCLKLLCMLTKSYDSALWSKSLLVHMAHGAPILLNPRTVHWSAQWFAIPYEGSIVMQGIMSKIVMIMSCSYFCWMHMSVSLSCSNPVVLT
jgi:hypothetical protein